MDCSPLGSSVHGVLQAKILEWVAISSSRGSSGRRDRTCVSCISCIGRQMFLQREPPRKSQIKPNRSLKCCSSHVKKVKTGKINFTIYSIYINQCYHFNVITYTFPGLNNHMWPVAARLDKTGSELLQMRTVCILRRFHIPAPSKLQPLFASFRPLCLFSPSLPLSLHFLPHGVHRTSL